MLPVARGWRPNATVQNTFPETEGNNLNDFPKDLWSNRYIAHLKSPREQFKELTKDLSKGKSDTFNCFYVKISLGNNTIIWWLFCGWGQNISTDGGITNF